MPVIAAPSVFVRWWLSLYQESSCFVVSCVFAFLCQEIQRSVLCCEMNKPHLIWKIKYSLLNCLWTEMLYKKPCVLLFDEEIEGYWVWMRALPQPPLLQHSLIVVSKDVTARVHKSDWAISHQGRFFKASERLCKRRLQHWKVRSTTRC